MTETYKDYQITYDEDSNKWRFDSEEGVKEFDSLKLAKAHIEKIRRNAKGEIVYQLGYWFKGEGWRGGGDEKIFECEFVKAEYGYFWIKCEGKRKKESGYDLYFRTPENKKLLEEIMSKNEEIQSIKKSIETIKNNLAKP